MATDSIAAGATGAVVAFFVLLFVIALVLTPSRRRVAKEQAFLADPELNIGGDYTAPPDHNAFTATATTVDADNTAASVFEPPPPVYSPADRPPAYGLEQV